MPAPTHVLRPQPLSAAGFAPFGEVVEAGTAAPRRRINAGFAERFDDLARLDTQRAGGRALVNIFRAVARPLPLRLSEVERHQLGSQLFMPLAQQCFLVVVAAAGPAPSFDALHCFLAGPGQGVNLAAGTWHHPLLALDDGDFLVVDRGGPGLPEDCDVHSLAAQDIWVQR
jgi:ureidoglycolate lyase